MAKQAGGGVRMRAVTHILCWYWNVGEGTNHRAGCRTTGIGVDGLDAIDIPACHSYFLETRGIETAACVKILFFLSHSTDNNRAKRKSVVEQANMKKNGDGLRTHNFIDTASQTAVLETNSPLG